MCARKLWWCAGVGVGFDFLVCAHAGKLVRFAQLWRLCGRYDCVFKDDDCEVSFARAISLP